MKKIIAISMFLCVFFTGCEQEAEDKSVSEVTITGIPEKIPVFGGDATDLNDTYKVYLNASDSPLETADPVAKGVAKIEGTPTGGKYTVKIKLQKPNTTGNDDPNEDTGSWTGTAAYFSVVISPKNVSGGVNTIWARGGYTLDKGKASFDWGSLINFRIEEGQPDSLGLNEKSRALFNKIVCKDSDSEMVKPE